MRINTVLKKYLPQENLSFQGTAQEVKRVAAEQLSLQNGQFSSQYLQTLNNSIKSYINKANNVMNGYKREFQQVQDQFPSQTAESPPKESYIRAWRRWKAAKNSISKNPNIGIVLQEGYVLIDTIRAAITGSEIVYHVGAVMGQGHSRTLYEGNLNLQQVLDMSYAAPIWKNTINSVFKLRLKRRVKSLTQSLQKSSAENYTFYLQVRNIAFEEGIRNEGNIFEAYRGLSLTGYNKTKSEIISYLHDTVKNTISFIKGGDIGDESIKFFNADPSFASLSTLVDAFINLSQVFSLSNTTDIQRGLEIMFTKEGAARFNQGAFDNAMNEELKQLYSILSKI